MSITVRGHVAHGNKLGRKLGFPTANILPGSLEAQDGVYVARVRLNGAGEGHGRGHAAIANLGVRPSVTGGNARVLEVHIFDFSDDIYGRQMEVELVRFMRPEEHFASVDKLRMQIGRDVQKAKEFFRTGNI